VQLPWRAKALDPSGFILKNGVEGATKILDFIGFPWLSSVAFRGFVFRLILELKINICRDMVPLL